MNNEYKFLNNEKNKWEKELSNCERKESLLKSEMNVLNEKAKKIQEEIEGNNEKQKKNKIKWLEIYSKKAYNFL